MPATRQDVCLGSQAREVVSSPSPASKQRAASLVLEKSLPPPANDRMILKIGGSNYVVFLGGGGADLDVDVGVGVSAEVLVTSHTIRELSLLLFSRPSASCR